MKIPMSKAKFIVTGVVAGLLVGGVITTAADNSNSEIEAPDTTSQSQTIETVPVGEAKIDSGEPVKNEPDTTPDVDTQEPPITNQSSIPASTIVPPTPAPTVVRYSSSLDTEGETTTTNCYYAMSDGSTKVIAAGSAKTVDYEKYHLAFSCPVRQVRCMTGKIRKKQEDRLLKQLSHTEKKHQRVIRALIAKDDFIMNG